MVRYPTAPGLMGRSRHETLGPAASRGLIRFRSSGHSRFRHLDEATLDSAANNKLFSEREIGEKKKTGSTPPTYSRTSIPKRRAFRRRDKPRARRYGVTGNWDSHRRRRPFLRSGPRLDKDGAKRGQVSTYPNAYPMLRRYSPTARESPGRTSAYPWRTPGVQLRKNPPETPFARSRSASTVLQLRNRLSR